MSPLAKHRPPVVIGYTRVSTQEQYGSGAGLAAQEAAIRAEVDHRGWTLLEMIGEEGGASSATLERPGLQRAMALLDAGTADVLVVSKLDRLSRSTVGGGQVLERAQRKGWSLVALDFGLDSSTVAGEMVANVILATSQYERRMIGQRTRDALAQKKAQGVRLGRATMLPTPVLQRIVDARRDGQSLRAIAAELTADGVPTAMGGAEWKHTTITAALRSQAAQGL